MKRLVLIAGAALASTDVAAQRTLHLPLVQQLPLSARSLSMGGASPGSREVEGALVNPALVGGNAVAVTGASYHARARAGSLGMTNTIGPMGIGVTVSYLDYASARTAAGGPRISDDVLARPGAGRGASLVGAVAVSNTYFGIRWGAGATLNQERVDASRGSAGSLTIGAAKDGVFGGMTVGAALQNLGVEKLFLAGTEFDLPARLSIGFAGLPGVGLPLGAYLDLNAAGALAVRRDGFVSGHLGTEVTWVPIEGVSVGWRVGIRRAELAVQRPLTAGVGATFDRLTLDYAWEQLRGGGAHRLTARLR